MRALGDADFRGFYAAYPRKVGPRRPRPRISGRSQATSHEDIMDGLRRALLAWERNRTEPGIYPSSGHVAHDGRWADELLMPPMSSADPIGEADRMTRNEILRKMNGHGDAAEFPGTHRVVPDRPPPGVWRGARKRRRNI